MDAANVLKPYDLRNEARSMFNNPIRSDVRFLVEGQTIYGHKMILGMGSPVFDRMFFGDLKEQREEIEIKDLTLVGFKNALRYIYGHPIDFELFDLYESYMAADKYLLHHFGEALFDYVKAKLNAETSCLIYDQLMKIGEREEISLADVRTMIIENSKATIESEHFTKIDQETLIGLLSLDELTVDEDELLAAVSKWVDCEVQRQGLPADSENLRKVFEPIKGYIVFTALTPEKIANCKKIAKILTWEEVGSLFLHLLNKENPWTIELKSPRNAGFSLNRYTVFVSDLFNPETSYRYLREVRLRVSRRVQILTVYTTYSERVPGASLRILDSNGVDLGSKTERLAKDGKLCFSVNPPLDVQPNCSYTLKVTADSSDSRITSADKLSKQNTLNFKGFEFDLDYSSFSFPYECHCIRGLEFSRSV